MELTTLKNKELAVDKRLIRIVVTSLVCVFLTSIAYAQPSPEGIQTYQKNVHLSPEHKQKLADDIDRYRNADNLWDVLRDEFTLPHYENYPAVQDKIDWYMNNQDFLIRSVNRASPYLYYILQQVKKRHLPAELVLLPIIESGYNPFSMSPVGAAGIWQLMPATANDLGVRQDWWYDGRRDVITSTRAALNHLAYLQRVYDGNWLLALAAYDTGEGNLRNAILKNIRSGRDTDFWSLPVAAETRNYVPSLLAVAVIISHPEQYPIYFPPVRNAPYLAQIDIGSQVNLKQAAVFAGISFKKIKQLNPGYNRPLTPNKGQFKLVLPIERVEQFTENLVRSPLNTQINWVHYRFNTGDTLLSVAKKFNTTPEAILKLNQLSKNAIRRHMVLLIPTDKEKKARDTKNTGLVATQPYDRAKRTGSTTATSVAAIKALSNYTLQPGDTVYMVRSSDTLHGIAKRFHVAPDILRAANKLSPTRRLLPGKQLIIPTHVSLSANNQDGLQPGDTIYMVRKGDTIENIANKFHTSPASIRLSNLINGNALQEGERIVVPTHIQS